MRVMTDERRDAIVEAAAKLFEEVGVEAASMSELSKRLGGSKSTLYRYFPAKEELVSAVVRRFATGHMADAVAELEASIEVERALKESLLRFGDQALKVVANDSRARSIHRVIVAAAGQSRVGELFCEAGPVQMLAKLAQLVAVSVSRGEIRRVDPAVAASQFMALLNAQVSSRVYQMAPPPMKAAERRELVVGAVDFFLRAVAKTA
ncbi:TetR/AcrR family transcriptional regulator [Mitsuaria sp. GD03876]|uniref:TetR/AcrR family transcriptional regulator n=1 Tax=Mitsuaria sp. GD03876 TaxID=2975399 RepID=UPI002448D671|nr:TetR/AcrR family transcriptional regulator [Mitsuaria sp. GD03876]MDH0866281.1 TetR/AcrR family transcriptional regulator [Mitsuaria sp. GD03876]